MQQIFGHLVQRNTLKDLACQDKLPHALIFSGGAGIGKYRVALELAQLLACQARLGQDGSPCLSCDCCKLFLQNSYPDLQIIECSDKDQAAIDNIRQVLKRLQLSRFNKSSSRIAIFRDAEFLSVQVANLLLKNVEEPAPATYYIFVTQNAARIPATLRSRCQRWFFNSLTLKELLQIAQTIESINKLEKVQVEQMLALADGSAESLESLVDQFEIWNEVQEALDRIVTGDGAYAISFAQELATKKDQLKSYLRLLRIYLSQKLKASARSGSSIEQSAWAVTLTNIISAERLIFERNLSVASVLSCSFLPLVSDTELYQKNNLPNSAGVLEKIVVT